MTLTLAICSLLMLLATAGVAYVSVRALTAELQRERTAHADTRKQLCAATDRLLLNAGHMPLSLPDNRPLERIPGVWDVKPPSAPVTPVYPDREGGKR